LDAVAQPVPRREERFTSWKEIAAYLKRDIRTVQRWETSRGLPVHRLPGKARSPIYALKSELDEWWRRTPARLEAATVLPLVPSYRRWPWVAAAVLTATAAVPWIVWRHGRQPAPLPVVPLTSLPGAEYSPALSPDGTRLAFSWTPAGSQNQDVYIMDLPGGNPRRVTNHPAGDVFAEWSPDGQRLAYIRADSTADSYELRLVNLRDGSDRKLLESPIPGVDVPAWHHTWTPDGEGLILPRPRQPGGPLGMTLLNLKTGMEYGLTEPVSRMIGEITPALSPDGRRLVFQRRTLAGEADLFLVDLKPDYTATGPLRQVTHEGCCVEAPSWTRDGREIIFVFWKGGTRRLARIGAGGGSIRFDPTVPAVGFAPRVAPDGRLIFHDTAWVGSILRVDLKEPGAAAKRLIASSRHDGSPAYSPDGKWIVFSSDRDGSRQLWICDNDGRAPRQLTHLEGVSAWYPVYSPDGRWIAFEGRRGNDSDIYLANSLSGAVTPLLQDKRAEQRPRWSRDGRRLYFATDSTGRFEIWSVDVDEKGKAGAVTQITHQGGYIALESADGRQLYYAGWASRQIGRISNFGGPEVPVPGVGRINRYPANVAAGHRGLYYLGQFDQQGLPLYFLPFQPGLPRRLAVGTWVPSPLGIAVSPDDRSLLVSVSEQTSGDILSVPSFR
jgi:Tol biopolymer transport system component